MSKLIAIFRNLSIRNKLISIFSLIFIAGFIQKPFNLPDMGMLLRNLLNS